MAGRKKNMEPDKCDDLSWFPINKLPKNTIPFIREATSNVNQKIFYSEFGY
jgi:8-oxo-dGTP diphosphatase